jgi:hypothetical protein
MKACEEGTPEENPQTKEDNAHHNAVAMADVRLFLTCAQDSCSSRAGWSARLVAKHVDLRCTSVNGESLLTPCCAKVGRLEFAHNPSGRMPRLPRLPARERRRGSRCRRSRRHGRDGDRHRSGRALHRYSGGSNCLAARTRPVGD